MILTVEEYLKIERESNVKYQYHDGYIYAMADGTINHSRISINIAGEIRDSLKKNKSGCEILNSDVKLYLSKRNKYLYPDNMVVCGDIIESKDLANSVTNPTLIIEVLSKSNAGYDQGEKFVFYKEIESLEEYIMIDQEEVQVHIYTRKSPELWKIISIEGMDKMLTISSLDIDVALSDIYYNVKI